ncbi:MAG TPA: hypothetical protein VGG19_06150 [Tepidisphaeraceae bacterium]
MNRNLCLLATVAGLTFAGMAKAVTVYDSTADLGNGTSHYHVQQAGYNYYSIGDTATPTSTAGTVSAIGVVFGSSATIAGNAYSYTPDLTLDIYPTAADAAAGTNLLGTATNNSTTFTNDGVVDPTKGYNYEDQQVVGFSFTGQGVSLPSTFAFVYHDNEAGDVFVGGNEADAQNNFSVSVTVDGATVGTASSMGFFGVYPDSTPPGSLDYSNQSGPSSDDDDAGFNIEARVDTVVPLPASAWSGLALLGGLAAFGGFKRLRKQTA